MDMHKDLLQLDKAVIEENFRTVFDESPTPMILHAEDGEMILINKKAIELLGYEFEEINTLEKWMTKLHRSRLEYNANFVKDIFDNGITRNGERELVYSKDGKEMYWEFHNNMLHSLSDGRRALITVMLDVTEYYVTNQKLEKLNTDLTHSQALLEASLESHKDMIMFSIDNNYCYYNFNTYHKNRMKEIYGSDVAVGKNILDLITVKEDRIKAKGFYDIALSGEFYSIIEPYGEKNDIYFESSYSPIMNQNKEIIGAAILASDVTERLQEYERVQESEKNYRLLYSSMAQGLAIHRLVVDEQGEPIDYIVESINDSYERLFNVRRENIIGKRIKELFPTLEEHWVKTFGRVAITKKPVFYERYSQSVGKFLSTYSYPLDQGRFAVLITDITDRVKRQKEIEYLSYNDQLTGLYNRRYYEEKLAELDSLDNLPLSIIMGDVNGLKLVNDSFGHPTGDQLLIQVAQIMKESCRDTDIISRVGGDEFVIILPRTTNLVAKKIINRINKKAKEFPADPIELSVSFGYATKKKIDQSLIEILKKVEDEMYSLKLNESHSMRSKTIDLIMTTLYEKNEREMFHSKRVSGLCEGLAKAAGLKEDQVIQTKTAGLMHDIGKIGINEDILNKKGKLTPDELTEVRRHSEIGYRILSSANELSEIASIVLSHHERWDGTGYPKGLKETDVSVQARIVNICDSYDAMTGLRTYRKVLTKEEAIQELKDHSGTQFDPRLVDLFINEVLKKAID